MISFKLFYENTNAGIIVPADIYSFYYISNYKSSLLQSDHNRETILNFLNNLKSKYLNTFSIVLKDQIEKYLGYQQMGRKRIKTGAELLQIDAAEFLKNPVVDFDKLEKYIKETTRSNSDPNENWNIFAEWMNKLSKKQVSIGSINAEGQENILFIIDRINNCVHNTKEPIFDKVRENGKLLINAFETAHKARDARFLKTNSQPEIKEMEVSSSVEDSSGSRNISRLEKQFGGSGFYKHSGD